MSVILTIDPGVTGTGWAMFGQRTERLLDYGTLYPEYCETWQLRALDLLRKFDSALLRTLIKTFYIEYPMFMGGAGGRMVAASGDLVKLATLTGMFIGAVNFRFPKCSINLVHPSEWKGQLPKDVANERVRDILKAFDPSIEVSGSNHALDALGIGLWATGRFN